MSAILQPHTKQIKPTKTKMRNRGGAETFTAPTNDL